MKPVITICLILMILTFIYIIYKKRDGFMNFTQTPTTTISIDNFKNSILKHICKTQECKKDVDNCTTITCLNNFVVSKLKTNDAICSSKDTKKENKCKTDVNKCNTISCLKDLFVKQQSRQVFLGIGAEGLETASEKLADMTTKLTNNNNNNNNNNNKNKIIKEIGEILKFLYSEKDSQTTAQNPNDNEEEGEEEEEDEDKPDPTTFDKMGKIMLRLSNCMLNNRNGWGGVGEDWFGMNEENEDKTRYTKFSSAQINGIMEIIQTNNKNRNNNRNNNNCSTFREEIRDEYEKLFNKYSWRNNGSNKNPTTYSPSTFVYYLKSVIDLKNMDYKVEKGVKNNINLSLHILFWLQQKGFLQFNPTSVNEAKYNKYFKSSGYELNKPKVTNILVKFIKEYLVLKKKIINATILNTDLKPLAEGLEKFISFNTEKALMYSMVVFDILVDPLEKCRCINLG